MDLITDKLGSMTFASVAPNVCLSRAEGHISPALGAAQIQRLDAALQDHDKVRYFCDARGIKSYDLLARSALVRFLLSHRKRFSAICMLVSAEDMSMALQAFRAAIGEPLVLTANASEFARHLAMAAPDAAASLAPVRERVGAVEAGHAAVQQAR